MRQGRSEVKLSGGSDNKYEVKALRVEERRENNLHDPRKLSVRLSPASQA